MPKPEKPVAYGPQNPHPLSTLRTELVWEGKYDEYGNRREVDVAGCAMPMQRIETIDQPRSEAAAAGQLDLFEKETTRQGDFRNRLIWGDNKLVMASLLREFKGKIDLIYIDPPFDVGADFSMTVPIGDDNDSIFKDQSTLEMVAYRDTWGKGADSYLQMLYERLLLMRELLAPHGSIWLHFDYHVIHYAKTVLDDVFGRDNFMNEVIWKRSSAHSDSSTCGNAHDTLLFYCKDVNNYIWNTQYQPYNDSYIKSHYRYTDDKGRRYRTDNLTAMGLHSGGYIYEWNGVTKEWRCPIETMQRYHDTGRLRYTRSGTAEYIRYLDEMPGLPLQDMWDDINPVNSQAIERLFYNTQKPELLIERMIRLSSNDGDLVADFFCGSGTTGAVAERLGRRWIMADLGRFAIHTSRKRLIDLQRQLHADGKPYRAFDVYNLGRYERQWWQKERLHGADEEHRRVVLEFFRAEILRCAQDDRGDRKKPSVERSCHPERSEGTHCHPERSEGSRSRGGSVSPSPLIHGRKGTALCHVDGIDSIFSRGEAREVAKAAAQAGARDCYCLAWEFEMDLRLTTQALETEFGVKLKLVQIPREIMEKNRNGPPPFLEVAVLEASPVYRKAAVCHPERSEGPHCHPECSEGSHCHPERSEGSSSRGKKGEILRCAQNDRSAQNDGSAQNDKGERNDKAVDIKLTKFLPSLAEVPTKELEAIRERAARSGFDFIDFWAVDFDWGPDRPFNHHWQDYRTRKDRSLKTVSEAGHVYPKKGVYTACVKVVDTFGCDTSIAVEVRV